MPRTALFAFAVAFALSASGTASAQSRRTGSSDDSCRDGSRGRQSRHCEVRESTIQGVNPIDIDAGQNGGIKLRGWDRADVLVLARIEAYGDSDAEARALHPPCVLKPLARPCAPKARPAATVFPIATTRTGQ